MICCCCTGAIVYAMHSGLPSPTQKHERYVLPLVDSKQQVGCEVQVSPETPEPSTQLQMLLA